MRLTGPGKARNVIETSIKKRWHQELVARPATHAWVLNLYRAGELHPATVDDYFPVEHAPPSLALKLAKHRGEEAMHARLYEQAVRKLGEPVEDFAGLDVFNVAIRTHTPVSFKIDVDDAADVKTAKLAHFFAHAHFLESRIAHSLELHVDACQRAGQGDIARVVGVVLQDELEHASYTRTAVGDLLPAARAREVLELHRRGEGRANLAFSARQVRSHVQRHAPLPSSSSSLWRFCAFLMEAPAHV